MLCRLSQKLQCMLCVCVCQPGCVCVWVYLHAYISYKHKKIFAVIFFLMFPNLCVLLFGFHSFFCSARFLLLSLSLPVSISLLCCCLPVGKARHLCASYTRLLCNLCTSLGYKQQKQKVEWESERESQEEEGGTAAEFA